MSCLVYIPGRPALSEGKQRRGGPGGGAGRRKGKLQSGYKIWENKKIWKRKLSREKVQSYKNSRNTAILFPWKWTLNLKYIYVFLSWPHLTISASLKPVLQTWSHERLRASANKLREGHHLVSNRHKFLLVLLSFPVELKRSLKP